MPKYTVYLTTTASTSVEVEAEDVDAAIEAAYDQGMPTICAQCSGWGRSYNLDMDGEWNMESVADEDGNTVHEEHPASTTDPQPGE